MYLFFFLFNIIYLFIYFIYLFISLYFKNILSHIFEKCTIAKCIPPYLIIFDIAFQIIKINIQVFITNICSNYVLII